MAKTRVVSNRVWLRLKKRDRVLQSIERRVEDALRANEKRSPSIDGAVARVLDEVRASRERETIIVDQIERLGITTEGMTVQGSVDLLVKECQELRSKTEVYLTEARAVSRTADRLPLEPVPYEPSLLLRGRGDYGRRGEDDVLKLLTDAQKRITLSAEHIERRTKALEARSVAGDEATIALAKFVTNRSGGVSWSG